MNRVGRAALIFASGCTWGTYDGQTDASFDGGSAGDVADAPADRSWPKVFIDPAAGATLTSDDGLFEVVFPPQSVNVFTYATIVRNLDASGLPTFCQSKSLSCWASAYGILLQSNKNGTSSQLTGTIGLAFHLSQSTFGAQQTQTFIVKPGPQAMPGVWNTTGDVSGFQGVESSSSVLGPYAIVATSPSVPSVNACSNATNVCDATCAANCSTTCSAPPPSAGIHESCMCAGPSPTTDACLGSCVTTTNPLAETCP